LPKSILTKVLDWVHHTIVFIGL